MKKYYSGIGSRETPTDVQESMTYIASVLELKGWTLRSGNADGADQAFAKGVTENAQIWLPWPKFNIEFQKEHPKHTYKTVPQGDIDSLNSVKEFHPNFNALSPGGLALMRRNYYQVVGRGEPNSSFVICWTQNAALKGGTAQAMKIALNLGIPVYNLWNMSKESLLETIIKKHE